MEYVAAEQGRREATGHAAAHAATCGIAAARVAARCMLSGSKQRGGSKAPLPPGGGFHNLLRVALRRWLVCYFLFHDVVFFMITFVACGRITCKASPPQPLSRGGEGSE